MSKNFLNYVLIFLVISLGFQLFLAEPQTTDPNAPAIQFEAAKKEFAVGKVVEINIKNNYSKAITFKQTCPEEPFSVYKTTNGSNTLLSSKPNINCEKNTDQNAKAITVKPNQTGQIRYTLWSHDLFSELGTYKVGGTFSLDGKEIKVLSNEFEIVEKGFFGNIWTSVFYQPIYNILIGLIGLSPNLSLSFGIILLTIIIRLALYMPNQKALLAQKRMAEVQPKLNEIRTKHKDNQQKMAEETMKIWKDHKVNPVSSCLPILIQFPILIALFYVIQDGLNPDKTWLLYSFLDQVNLSQIDTNFLNILELTTKNVIVLPLIVGALQFIQMKLAMSKNVKKDQIANDPNAMAQNMMLYMMPAMIAVFTASMPAGIGLYWGTSTFLGIIQQYFVNKHVDSEMEKMKMNKSKKGKKDDIRVIDVN
jgi:YidC/Oxa1 family membrane protein insertase